MKTPPSNYANITASASISNNPCIFRGLFINSCGAGATIKFFDEDPYGNSQNHALNSSFEDDGAGGADVFAQWSENIAGTSTITKNTANPYTGEAALALNIDGLGSACNVEQVCLTIGAKYIAKVKAKVDSTAGAPSIRFQEGGNPITGGTITPTTEYAEYTVTFTATNTAFGIGRHLATANKIFYIDDITVEKLNSEPIGGTITMAAIATPQTGHIYYKKGINCKYGLYAIITGTMDVTILWS